MTDTQESFFVHVSSHSDRDIFPLNSSNCFINRLPRELNGIYSCSLIGGQFKLLPFNPPKNNNNNNTSSSLPTPVPPFFLLGESEMELTKLKTESESILKKGSTLVDIITHINFELQQLALGVSFQILEENGKTVIEMTYVNTEGFTLTVDKLLLLALSFEDAQTFETGKYFSKSVDIEKVMAIPDDTELTFSLHKYETEKVAMQEPDSTKIHDMIDAIEVSLSEAGVKAFLLLRPQQESLHFMMDKSNTNLISVKLPQKVNRYLNLDDEFVFASENVLLLLPSRLFKKEAPISPINQQNRIASYDFASSGIVFITCDAVDNSFAMGDYLNYIFCAHSCKEGINYISPKKHIYLQANKSKIRDLKFSICSFNNQLLATDPNFPSFLTLHFKYLGEADL